MSSPLERSIKIEVRLPSHHPQLLQGLDIWLSLGLISDAQVRQLCREFLVCSVRLEPRVESVDVLGVSQRIAEKSTVISNSGQPSVVPGKQKPSPQLAKPNLFTEILQSLLSELSVRWLLFLGVFLVVLSSGVLAASQWEKFPAAGQYSVLFAYTLSFWGLSFWTGKQSNLRLTTQTLLTVTLLLVPVNFWAIDSFGLWQNPVNWIVVAIASFCLTAITVLISKSRFFAAHLPHENFRLVNILGLSYLHWGWKLSGFPLIALYLAVVGTSLIIVYQTRLARQRNRQSGLGMSLPASIVIYALLVLLVRGIFVARVDITQLGLAIGICGWLVAWLAVSRTEGVETRHDASLQNASLRLSVPWQLLGGILLFLGWLVSVITHPWQAIAVSGLSLWFFSSRLQRYNLQPDFAAIFVIGLETIWLGWRLVPYELQKWAIAIATQLTNSQNQAWALLSIALFPYLILMVALTELLHHVGRREVAKFGELLTLFFACVLTTIALVNPVLRSLNLLFSTVTLAIVTQRRREEDAESQRRKDAGRLSVPSSTNLPTLIYLTHITGVLTFCSIVDWFFPSLRNEHWAMILLALMVGEWLFSIGDRWWRRSAWHIGLGLAIISFLLLWVNADLAWRNYGATNANWGLIWLITPITLTGIASRSSGEKRTTNSILSVVALGFSQLLTLPLLHFRLISLAVAAALMFVNTNYLRHKAYAVITLGFVLSTIGTLLWEGVPGFPKLAIQGWFVVGAIAILGLWLTRKLLRQTRNELASIYADATDKWAIALCGVELLSLTLHSVLVYMQLATPGLLYLAAGAITLGAIVYRSWGEATNFAFYGIGWCLELLTAEVLGFSKPSIIQIAIANIGLGLITQLFGEWWQRRHRLERLPSSFHILPLMYGGFSLVLRLNTFTKWTGLASLGVALIAIGVGRRRQEFKPLVYLGLVGISISAYELLFYQMLQASGGAWGDGLIAMSALGTSMMYAYRILSPWLSNYLRLSTKELKIVAHLHWAWSSFLLIAAIAAPIQVNRLLGLGAGIFLIRYAIFQGRDTETTRRGDAKREDTGTRGRGDAGRGEFFASILTPDEIWVYLGLLEVAAMRIYWRETAVGQLFAGALVPWNAAIACVVAYFLYILPWESWGWSKRPWQTAAYILPLVLLWETRLQIYSITLLLTAAFYVFLAKMSNQFRVTYMSVALINWAVFRWFDDLGLTDALWYVSAISLSLLYIAQFDPQLKLPDMKAYRHYWRLLASGLICGWAILFHQDIALIPGIFSLIAIFAGLGLRVRAFLYVGTATFFITAFYQLIIFSLRYPFFKWLVGLVVGIILISIAANFETRRAQLSSILRSTSDKFQDWQ
ncbi:DUF2157 domain-containing protein [Chlorogloeopsis sp. ULAP02]|uniref:DUF2157 domain-containing protein n=1 Tax=Chlorogloeopsis sp. ULAP02 TaxID=3107926 RepID=UPI003135E294